MKFKILVSLLFLLVLPLSAAFSAEGNDPVFALKSRMLDLTEENQRLLAEHELLLKRLSGFGAGTQNVPIRAEDRSESPGDQKNLAAIKRNIEMKRGQILVAQTKIIEARRELVDLQDSRSALESELGQVSPSQKTQGKNVPPVPRRSGKNDLMNLKQGRAQILEKKVSDLEEALAFYPQKAKDFRRENESLEGEIRDWEKKVELKERELSLLKSKRELRLIQENAGEPPKGEDYSVLKEKTTGLENELAQLRNKLDEAMSAQKIQRQLLNNIMRLDQENQALRAKVSQLESGQGRLWRE